MKTPKLIIKGLVSGRVKLTPELLEALKRYHAGREPGAKEETPPNQGPRATESPGKSPPDQAPPCRSQRRMVFVSPLPGRWVRCCGLVMTGIALWLAPTAQAAAPGDAFDMANRAFAEARMASAAQAYQAILDRYGYSAPALFNLANAQFRDGKIGLAILNYERAHWLAPNDPDIAANLEIARQKAGLPPEAPSRLRAAVDTLTLNAWCALAVAALLLLVATFPMKRLLSRRRFALNAIAVFATATLLAAASAVATRWADLDDAIVTVPDTAARVSPVTVIPASFTLHAGETVRLRTIHGPFALVTDRQGREGWVARETLVPIVPAGPQG